MHLTQKESLYVTLAYADIFGYPLTRQELRYWFIGNRLLQRVLSKDIFTFYWKKEQYIQYRRTSFVSRRFEKQMWAREKWKRAERVGHILGYIPTIQLIGVTGGLAMNNVKEHDDIDLFVIVSPKTIWISRLMVAFVLEVIGVRRKPNQVNIQNKICVNMYMSYAHLTILKNEQDLFSAHEVLQMQPVFDCGIYNNFLKANIWVKYFLPNAWDHKFQISNFTFQINRRNKVQDMVGGILQLLEPLAKTIQLWYMKKRRTTEIVSDTMLRFHPFDARVHVIKELARRLTRYKIPLDKVFYAR